MFKTDNNLYVFVGPLTGAFGHDVTTGAAATNEIHTVHETGVASGVLAAGDLFKISQKDADGNVRSTPLLAWNNLIKATGKLTDATTSEQNSVFGSNGTAGSIQAINSNRYTVRVNFKNNVDMYSEQSDLHFFEYVADDSATQVEIADYLAQTMSKSEKFSGKNSGKKRASVKVERVTDSTLTASTSGTIAVTNGSKQVTAVTDIDDGGAAIVGGYLVLDGVAYKVVSISGQTATLDQPYQGATNATLGDGSTNEISAANAAAGNWGLKITGVAQEWKLGLLPYSQVTFEVTLDGWGNTTALANTAAVTAAGQGHKIAELEWFSQGSAGAPYRHGAVPSNADNITLVADKDDFYDVIEMQFDLADPKHAVAGAGAGKVSVVVALPDAVASADGTMGNDVFGFGSDHIFNE
jgi:hypothetical protein